MNGDLRLVRKRWWGTWAALGLVVLCISVLVLDWTPATARPRAFALAGCVPLLLVFYAPWTFFNLMRVVCALLALTWCWMVVRHWMEVEFTSRMLVKTLVSACLFLAPMVALALSRRPAPSPYDERGRVQPDDAHWMRKSKWIF